MSVSSLIGGRVRQLVGIYNVSESERYYNHVVLNVVLTWVTQYTRGWLVAVGWRSGSIVAVHMLVVLTFDDKIGAHTPHIEP